MTHIPVAGVIAATVFISSAIHAQGPPSAVGLWVTEGYGLVFDVRQDSVASFEVTKVSCVPATRAATTTPPANASTSATNL